MFDNVVRKQVQQPDGTMKMVFVDSQSGQEVGNPYVLESGTVQDLKSLGIDPVSEPEKPKENIKPRVLPLMQSGDGSDRAEQERTSGAKEFNRGANNNFGYVNKPDWMSYVSLIPGLGKFATAANIGVNANNLAASNQARDMMDVPKAGFMDSVRGLARDQKGYIADVNIGEKQYGVGFEAQDSVGRSMLTPNEARQRAGYMGEDISLASREQAQNARTGFAQANPDLQDKSLFGSGFKEKARGVIDDVREAGRNIFSETKGLIDSLFDDDDDYEATPTNAPTPTFRDSVGRSEPASPNGYDSVGTPSNNDASFGGPR